jgi:hypothetical protein
VSYAQCCHSRWIVQSLLSLRFSLTFMDEMCQYWNTHLSQMHSPLLVLIKICNIHPLCYWIVLNAVSYLCYFCLFLYSGVQHILLLYCVFVLFSSSMLPVSLDCPFLIATSVFCNVNLNQTLYKIKGYVCMYKLFDEISKWKCATTLLTIIQSKYCIDIRIFIW